MTADPAKIPEEDKPAKSMLRSIPVLMKPCLPASHAGMRSHARRSQRTNANTHTNAHAHARAPRRHTRYKRAMQACDCPRVHARLVHDEGGLLGL